MFYFVNDGETRLIIWHEGLSGEVKIIQNLSDDKWWGEAGEIKSFSAYMKLCIEDCDINLNALLERVYLEIL